MSALTYPIAAVVGGVLICLLIRGIRRWWADYNAALTLPKTDAWTRRDNS